ncbi:hypothetical protein TNCT_598721 [Trichonephila clavata]|uniref:Uncharacterized protein n=1 Tax=Trichonephila clavata TaxID=2740835 RepID=A0A8X6FK87_TRICU|nr:hypothetical protein TNCT_598721 [Trichonephila clavata]
MSFILEYRERPANPSEKTPSVTLVEPVEKLGFGHSTIHIDTWVSSENQKMMTGTKAEKRGLKSLRVTCCGSNTSLSLIRGCSFQAKGSGVNAILETAVKAGWHMLCVTALSLPV